MLLTRLGEACLAALPDRIVQMLDYDAVSRNAFVGRQRAPIEMLHYSLSNLLPW
jgi:hypothetical protein